MSLKRKILNKCLILVYVLLALLFAKFLFDYVYNEIVISKYNDRDYNVTEDMLLYANFFEPYLPYYNTGNIQYKKNQFEKAIESYEKALAYDIPQDKECSVRINLALAKIGTLGEDYNKPENIDSSLEVLYSARDVLLEKGCATREGDGHSETAEKLREEIEKIIDELEQQKEQQSQAGNGGEGGSDGQDQNNGGDGQSGGDDSNGGGQNGGDDSNGDGSNSGDDSNGGDDSNDGDGSDDGDGQDGDDDSNGGDGSDDGDDTNGGSDTDGDDDSNGGDTDGDDTDGGKGTNNGPYTSSGDTATDGSTRGAGDTERQIRDTLLQQEQGAYQERQQGLDEVNNYTNWDWDDGEIW